MYWLSPEDPIYQYNLLQASFVALDELFAEDSQKRQTNADSIDGNASSVKNDKNTRESEGLLGKLWRLYPTSV